jgi:hypothetical protein
MRALRRPDRRSKLHLRARLNAADISIPLVAVAIALVASLLTLDLNHRVTREQDAQRALQLIQLNEVQLQALEARLVVLKKVRVADIAAAERMIDEMAAQSDTLADLNRASGTVVAVGELSSAFGQLVPPVAEQDPSLMNGGVYLAR